MEYISIKDILPDTLKETRCLSIVSDDNALPRGTYIFSESYCSNPDCDCRRVFINVFCVKGELAR